MLELADSFDDAFGVAVSRVDDQRIDAGFHQRTGAFRIIWADRGGDPEPVFRIPVVVGRHIGEQGGYILKTVKPFQMSVSVYQRKLADLVFPHNIVGFLHRGGNRRGHHFAGHDFRNLAAVVGQKFDVPGGDDSNQFSGRIDNWKTGERVLFDLFFIQHFFHGHIFVEHHGIADQTVEVLLDLPDFVRLLKRIEILMDYADPAEFGHGDCHGTFRDRIHGGADKRDVHLDVFGKGCGYVGIAGQKVRILGEH